MLARSSDFPQTPFIVHPVPFAASWHWKQNMLIVVNLMVDMILYNLAINMDKCNLICSNCFYSTAN